MTDVINDLDRIEDRVLSGLKDFQRATVERIDELYRAPNNQHRVLVSDEVGLGKTLVARGVIAKFAKMSKREGDDLVKVVYICSNGAIADQNLNKLRIAKGVRKEGINTSRLSMQHLNIFNQENDKELKKQYIQLIPLTPDTSFRMTQGAGTVSERALMFAILCRLPKLRAYKKELEELMVHNAQKSWNGWVKQDCELKVKNCDKDSKGEYLKYMKSKLLDELQSTTSGQNCLMDDLRKALKARRNKSDEKINEQEIIARLRIAFAKISIEKLEPDLLIMDEFQRFKYLLDADPESDTGLLRQKFFDAENLRMLLLSATPYKMYSTLEEIDSDSEQIDEHYSEFFKVMDFLNEKPSDRDDFREIWTNYSVKLRELKSGDTSIIQVKNVAEDAMYGSVCRTERITEEKAADLIDDHQVHEAMDVAESDIKSYLNLQGMLDEINLRINVPVDYVKSSPYLLSFMKDYQLKKKIEDYFMNNSDQVDIADKDTFWLERKRIDKYEEIPFNNARVEMVMAEAMGDGAENMLWVPPARPYYEFGGAFKGHEDFSKTLIFSAWEMVPRMIASLFSYEAERRTIGKLREKTHDKNARYFHGEDKRYPAPRLTFRKKDNRPAAMTLFCLLYPSKFLSDIYSPIDCMNKKMSLEDIEDEIRMKLEDEVGFGAQDATGNVDYRWYYMLPLMFDKTKDVYTWLERCRALETEGAEAKSNKKAYEAHIDYLRYLYDECLKNNWVNLGKQPPNLVQVLVDMAIASPAICMYRSLEKYSDDVDYDEVRVSATKIAQLFLHRMNAPEAIATIDVLYGENSTRRHWLNLLKYCKEGNMQAVFDEYLHLIAGGVDEDENLLENICAELMASMSIRTTFYSVDTFAKFKADLTGKGDVKDTKMRTHYAVAFTKGEETEKSYDRKKVVRNAFNSPFRPFVLASTSIGQEGLDFHNYCRRIVHWNLPSNPIDIEQREGRINRFKGLVIRQNVAKRYGDIEYKEDVWKELFEEALIKEKDKAGDSSDLIPYWGLTEEPDMIKIERIVPMYPFSKDEITYERLIKILSLYRLTLGQARQEELLEYIFDNFKGEESEKLHKLFINLSPYYKMRGKR